MSGNAYPTSGPTLAAEVREGDPWELSKGRAIWCAPASGSTGRANLLGGSVIGSDPAVAEAGIDVGYAPEESTLRAPDVAAGNVPDAPGWVAGVPPLAIEYAGVGQDFAELARKIKELLAAGTRHLWVVHLVGPRRVEVHEPGKAARTLGPGDVLLAPGILRNPVRVEELYDPAAAHEATLRNLLQRRGYESLEAVREEGELLVLREAILSVLTERGLAAGEAVRERLATCCDAQALRAWLRRSVHVESAETLLDAP